ncbi:DUF4386 domain-containing protein [Fontibacter flavus]|uniref:DUF4386 domain-containing protein n=1 Tax=Fontibacter flavus TaxID=654838 RepID=A0ABV6FX31_9BACT
MQISNQNQVKTASMTGIWYLALALSGVLGFMVIHPQIFITEDPTKTLENITQNTILARIRLLLEFAIIISQALTAVWFYKLFRSINEWGAWTLTIWGTVNSVVIMVSAISMATAIGIAESLTLGLGQKISLLELLNHLSSNAWGIGSLFFGLWLIPMGFIIVSSRRMPVWLGRILIIGGIGYLLSAFLGYLDLKFAFIDFLTIPATIGEFWLIAYLLWFGIRPASGFYDEDLD